jgi:hypothetical protein
VGRFTQRRIAEKLGAFKGWQAQKNKAIGLVMRVKNAEYIEDYKIKVMFSNGIIKVVDFASFLQSAKHVFLPLRSVEYFMQFQVDDITLSWPNGADFEPELLYGMGVELKSRSSKSSAKKTAIKPTRTQKRTSAKK